MLPLVTQITNIAHNKGGIVAQKLFFYSTYNSTCVFNSRGGSCDKCIRTYGDERARVYYIYLDNDSTNRAVTLRRSPNTA